MMPNNDLISRNAAIQSISDWSKDCDNESLNDAVTVIKTLIELLPAVDAVPMIHARWIDHKDEHQCSACKEFTIVDAYAWMQLRYDFCPYCSAKMDGKRREDNDD